MRLYHFTSEYHLAEILADGQVGVTESNVSFAVTHAGPDVVWLTSNPDRDAQAGWAMREPVDFAGHILRMPHDKTAVRITVDVGDAVPWLQWARAHNVPPLVKQMLIAAGGGLARAREWYVVEHPVPMEGAVVERMDQG